MKIAPLDWNKKTAKALAEFLDDKARTAGPLLHLAGSLIPFGLLSTLLPEGPITGTLQWATLGLALVATAHAAATGYLPHKAWQPHGNARFLNLWEVWGTGLLPRSAQGIVLGKAGNRLVVKPATQDGHVLVTAGSGLGKTKSVAIPSLLRWPGSALVINIKGDISSATATVRAAHQRVIDFNPTDLNTARYNPLAAIKSPRDALELARTIVPTLKGDNAYFSIAAQDVLAAAILDGAANGLTLPEVALGVRMAPIEKLISALMKSQTPGVPQLVASVVGVPEKTLGGAMGELKNNLTLLATDKHLANALSGSDWTPQTLERGATVYLTVPEQDFSTYAPIFRIIYNQVMKHLTGRGEGKQPPILLLLDEFAQLGKLHDFTERIATLRSRNVHCMVFIQDLSQVEELYGKNGRRTIMANCRYKLVLGVDDVETARYFSDLAGTRSAENISKSRRSAEEAETVGEIGVPLIRPEEWRNLKKPVLFPFQSDPIRVNQVWTNWDKGDIDPILGRHIERDLDRLNKQRAKLGNKIVDLPERLEQPTHKEEKEREAQ
jgi:type IV secretion system protein VirD4